jgi:hypothetical protein
MLIFHRQQKQKTNFAEYNSMTIPVKLGTNSGLVISEKMIKMWKINTRLMQSHK